MSLLPALRDDDPSSLYPPTLVVHGPGGEPEEHAHHGMHVVIAREGRIRAELGGGGSTTCAGVWIAPDVPHAIAASGRTVAMLFIDPESREGRALRRHAPGPVIALDDGARDRLLQVWPQQLGSFRDETFATAVLHALGTPRDAPPAVVHPGVRRALKLLREAPSPPTLKDLATVAELSQGRLIHAFTEQVGIPPRRYLLWIKVQRAARAIAMGSSIGDAAYAGGFSDAAHLSRTFRRMFGTTPVELVRNSQFVQAS